MGLGLCALKAGGVINTHLHSFEESFYVLEGQPTLILDGDAYPLVPGACGLVPVGVPHAWLGPAKGSAKWIDMLAPQPRVKGQPDDTFFTGTPAKYELKQLDIRDPRSRHLFRMLESDIVLDELKAGSRVSAPTVFREHVDRASRLQWYSAKNARRPAPGRAAFDHVHGRIPARRRRTPHDHPLEESYVILSGSVEAVADDARYTLRVGDAFWTGVGCVHAFYNTSEGTVRWLETQSPQLPPRYGTDSTVTGSTSRRNSQRLPQREKAGADPTGQRH